jgi:hypothetical protein
MFQEVIKSHESIENDEAHNLVLLPLR